MLVDIYSQGMFSVQYFDFILSNWMIQIIKGRGPGFNIWKTWFFMMYLMEGELCVTIYLVLYISCSLSLTCVYIRLWFWKVVFIFYITQVNRICEVAFCNVRGGLHLNTNKNFNIFLSHKSSIYTCLVFHEEYNSGKGLNNILLKIILLYPLISVIS